MTVRFLCVGDLDVDLMATVARLPSSDDKVAGRRVGLTVGGMSANVAVGLSRLGCPSRLVAAIGDDDHGVTAERCLEAERVDTRFLVRRRDVATFMCIVLLTGDGEKSLVRLETDAYLPRANEVPADAFVGIDHVHLTLGDAALARHCIAQAGAVGATVSLDLEKADIPDDPAILSELLPQLDWLFLNAASRAHIEHRLGADLLSMTPRVVTTLGAAGSRIDGDGGTALATGYRVPVRDSTGAGDGFVAAFLHARLIEGRPDAEALRRANAAAALVVQQYGAQTGLPTVAEIDRFLARQSPAVAAPSRRDRHA
ncbi:MAG: carbohydrate kinase family protein [Inquilinaceae bacterium]